MVNVYYSRNSYTVSFNLNRTGATLTIGGTTYTHPTRYSFTAKYNSDISELWPTATNIPNVGYYSFVGWPWSGTTYVSKRLTFTDDLFNADGTTRTYTASWATSVVTYHLHYMIESLTGEGDRQYNGVWYNEDLAYTQFANYSANANWSAKAISGVTNVGKEQQTTTGTDGDYDVYFYYTRISYELSFFNYNATVKTETLKFGTDISGKSFVPEKPAALAEGYTFAGWYTTRDLVQLFAWAGATMPPNNLELCAKWNPPSYTITYSIEPVGGGGLVPYAEHPQDVVLRGDQTTRPADPDPATYGALGYAFDGWYYVGTNTPFSFDSQIFRNIDLYGRWAPRMDLSYTVRYRQQGNESNAVATDKTVNDQAFGSTVTELAANVAGWYPDALSKSLTLDADNKVLTFWYTSLAAGYTVRYLNKITSEPLNGYSDPVKTVNPGDAGFPTGSTATESAPMIPNYPCTMTGSTVYVDLVPDKYTKSIVLTGTMANNVITFYYEFNSRYHYVVEYREVGTEVKLADDKVVRTTRVFTTELPKAIEGYTASPTQINTALTNLDANPPDPQILTFWYTPRKLEIAVTKAWADSNDQDGVRPDELPVTLTGSDGNTYSYTLLALENWAHTFIGLPKYKSGALITYTLSETLTGSDYTLTATTNPVNVAGDYALEGSLTNIHPASTTARIQVQKALTGRDFLGTDSFEFTLAGTIGSTQVSDTVTVTDGTVTGFNELTFPAAGTYDFTIKETGGSIGGLSYDTTAKPVTVTVVDNGDGTMTATVSPEIVVVTNVYTTTPVTAQITGTKTLSGRTGTFSDEFQFELDDADTQTLTFTANGTQGFAFLEKTYSLSDLVGENSKTFTYTVTELPYTIAGVSPVGATSVDVTVTVTDNKDGTLSAVVSPKPAVFENTYTTGTVTAQITGTKTLSGRTGTFSDEFQFELDDADTQTLTFTANGTQGFAFLEKTYSLSDLVGENSKTFTYTVTELPYTIAGVSPVGATSVDVTVTVTDNKDGTLSAVVSPASVDFTNTYSPPIIYSFGFSGSNVADCFE